MAGDMTTSLMEWQYAFLQPHAAALLQYSSCGLRCLLTQAGFDNKARNKRSESFLISQWGRFELRLCPLSANSDEAEKAELSDECLSQHQLELADGSGQYYHMTV